MSLLKASSHRHPTQELSVTSPLSTAFKTAFHKVPPTFPPYCPLLITLSVLIQKGQYAQVGKLFLYSNRTKVEISNYLLGGGGALL